MGLILCHENLIKFKNYRTYPSAILQRENSTSFFRMVQGIKCWALSVHQILTLWFETIIFKIQQILHKILLKIQQ